MAVGEKRRVVRECRDEVNSAKESAATICKVSSKRSFDASHVTNVCLRIEILNLGMKHTPQIIRLANFTPAATTINTISQLHDIAEYHQDAVEQTHLRTWRPLGRRCCGMGTDRLTNGDSGGGSRTTPAPTKSALCAHPAVSCDISTTRRRAPRRNAVTAGPSCPVYVYTFPSTMNLARTVNEILTVTIMTGPRPPSSRICHSQPAEEECSARVRRLALRKLRQGPRHPGVLD